MPGLVYQPPSKWDGNDYRFAGPNMLGKKVVADIEAVPKIPNKDGCVEVSYKRVRNASLCLGQPLPPYPDQKGMACPTFVRLWVSGVEPADTWLEIPAPYLGAGAPGAIEWAGYGRVLDRHEIWAGRLKPGAVVQVWSTAAALDAVRHGAIPTDWGHSVVFVSYERGPGGITGMLVSDHGWQDGKVVAPDFCPIWFGCNLPFQGFGPV